MRPFAPNSLISNRVDSSAVRTERYRDKGRRQFRRVQEEKGARGKGKQSALAERCPVPRILHGVKPQAAQPPFLSAFPPLLNSGNAKANSSDSSKELPPISDRSYRPGSKFEVNRRRHRPGRTIRANQLPLALVLTFRCTEIIKIARNDYLRAKKVRIQIRLQTRKTPLNEHFY